jgi:hypothetical protein
MATRQEANAPLLFVIGIVGVLLLLTVVYGGQAWFYYEQNQQIARKFGNTPVTWLQDLKEKQQQRLEQKGWVDQKNGIVRIPIEQAMQLIVENHGQLPKAK